jgi:hypothetical protein
LSYNDVQISWHQRKLASNIDFKCPTDLCNKSIGEEVVKKVERSFLPFTKMTTCQREKYRPKLNFFDTKTRLELESKIEKPTLCSASAAQADRPRFLTGEGCK